MYITNAIQKRGFSGAESRDLCQQVSKGEFLPMRSCYPIHSTEQRESFGIQILLNMILYLQQKGQTYRSVEWLICFCVYQSIMSCTLGQVLQYRTVWFYHAVSKIQHKIHFSYRRRRSFDTNSSSQQLLSWSQVLPDSKPFSSKTEGKQVWQKGKKSQAGYEREPSWDVLSSEVGINKEATEQLWKNIWDQPSESSARVRESKNEF